MGMEIPRLGILATLLSFIHCFLEQNVGTGGHVGFVLGTGSKVAWDSPGLSNPAKLPDFPFLLL